MDLMLALSHCGKHERAAAMAEEIRLGKEKDPELLLNVGYCYAQCAAVAGIDSGLKNQYEQKAVTAVQTAIKHGYKDLTTLETEPDLDPIRKNPDFGKLLTQLKAKAAVAQNQARSKN
jgi:hypothetical protein